MATLAITRPGTMSARKKHPQARFKPEGGKAVDLPYAPRTTTLGGRGKAWQEVARPGRRPLLMADGPLLQTLALTITLAHPDHQTSVEPLLSRLDALARGGERVQLLGMSPRERGPWRITELTFAGEQRQHGTNHITRATATMTLVQASDPNPRLGPVSGGKKGGKGGRKKLPTMHVVKKGDTLRKLANRYYGDPAAWRLIARANKLKDPGKLKVGKKLRIPKPETGGVFGFPQAPGTFVQTGWGN